MAAAGGGGKMACAVCAQEARRACARCLGAVYCDDRCARGHWDLVHARECTGATRRSPVYGRNLPCVQRVLPLSQVRRITQALRDQLTDTGELCLRLDPGAMDDVGDAPALADFRMRLRDDAPSKSGAYGTVNFVEYLYPLERGEIRDCRTFMVLKEERAAGPPERLLAEQAVLKRLTDLNRMLSGTERIISTPHYYMSWTCGTTVYTLMEDVEGRTMRRYLRGPLLDERTTVLRVLTSLRRACDALDGVGVEHGDLHAGNIIVRPSFFGTTVHVVDFGLAAMYAGLRRGTNMAQALWLALAHGVLPTRSGTALLALYDETDLGARLLPRPAAARPAAGWGYQQGTPFAVATHEQGQGRGLPMHRDGYYYRVPRTTNGTREIRSTEWAQIEQLL